MCIELSIIVPVYNVEKYLKKCIDSILNQTFKDFELILVDDGSTDSSGEICDEYSLKDNRIKVIHKENGGQSSARNVGLDIAQGEYIGFVDSDDWIEPNMYEMLYKIAKIKNSDIVVCDYSRFREKDKPLVKKEIKLKEIKLKEIKLEEIYEYIYLKKFPQISWSPFNKLWKRNLIGEKRFKEGRIYEDKLFLYKIIYRNLSIKITKISIELYHYRIDNLSTMRRNVSEKNLDHLKNTIDIYYLTPEKYKNKIFIEDFLHETESIYIKIIKERSIVENLALIKKVKQLYRENKIMIKNANVLTGYKKYKFFILIKIPIIYIIFKRITKRY